MEDCGDLQDDSKVCCRSGWTSRLLSSGHLEQAPFPSMAFSFVIKAARPTLSSWHGAKCFCPHHYFTYWVHLGLGETSFFSYQCLCWVPVLFKPFLRVTESGHMLLCGSPGLHCWVLGQRAPSASGTATLTRLWAAGTKPWEEGYSCLSLSECYLCNCSIPSAEESRVADVPGNSECSIPVWSPGLQV